MTHRPHALAAIASAAIPGLDPVSVQELTVRRQDSFQVALVQDTRRRSWVVRVPLSAAAGAELEQTEALTELLDRHVPYALPVAQGHVPMKGVGRASVSPFIPGHPLVFSGLPASPGLTAQIGRSIAALHDLDVRLYDEVAAPSYDAKEYRARRIADLDRAAGTGRVPTGLLARWEDALDESRLWQFTTVPVHGSLMGRNVLARFDGDLAEEGLVTGVTGWEGSRVADPAEDFAWLIGQCDPEAWEILRSAYVDARREPVDPFLDSRARLAAEMHLMTAVLAALTAGDEELADSLSEKLRYLDHDTSDDAMPLVPPRGQAPDVSARSSALSEDEDIIAPATQDAEPSEGVSQTEQGGAEMDVEPAPAPQDGLGRPATVTRSEPGPAEAPHRDAAEPEAAKADARLPDAPHADAPETDSAATGTAKADGTDTDGSEERGAETDVSGNEAVADEPLGPSAAPSGSTGEDETDDEAAFAVSPAPDGPSFVRVERPSTASTQLYDIPVEEDMEDELDGEQEGRPTRRW